MTRQMTAVLALGLALVLARPALAQQVKASEGAEKCAGGGEGSKCGGANAEEELDIRVQFDKEGAKGEIKCKKGKREGGKVKYEKCVQDKLDDYEKVAVEKKIVAKEKLDKLDAKKKLLAKKLAFYHSASKELNAKLNDMGKPRKEELEYLKTEGALKKIDKEFDKALAECAKEDKKVFSCPAKP